MGAARAARAAGRLWEALGGSGVAGRLWEPLGRSGTLWEALGADRVRTDGSRWEDPKLFREMLGMGLQSGSVSTNLIGVGEEVPNRWEEPE